MSDFSLAAQTTSVHGFPRILGVLMALGWLSPAMMTASKSSLHYRNCDLCEAICGVESTIQGGQRLDVRGDQDDHISQGYICPKAAALRDLHYDRWG